MGEPLFLDVVAALGEAHTGGEREPCRASSAAATGSRRRSSRPAMVAGVLAGARGGAPAAPVHGRHHRRRRRHQHLLRRAARHRAAGDGARGVLRPGLRRHGRREQEHDQDPRRRGGPARPGLLRLRLEEVGLADGLAPALRAEPIERAVPRDAARASSAATSSACSTRRRAGPGRRRGDAAARLPPPARRGLGRAAAHGAEADPRQGASTLYAIDATRVAREAGLAGRTNTVLQTCFFALSGVLPRDEAIERIKAAIEKTYARRGAEVVRAEQRRRRQRARGSARGRDARAGSRPTHEPLAVVPDSGAGVRPHGDRGDDGRPRRRAAGERAAGRRHLPERHDRVREAQHLRPRRRVGSRHLHPVRQLQLRLPAQRHPLALLRPGAARRRARRRSARRRSTRAACPDARFTLQVYVEDCTGLRALRRGMPGRRRRTTRPARRSTSRRASRSSTPSARTSRSSRRCPSTTAPASTSAPCAAPSSSSRCSSSRARAPGAARRRT